MYRLLLRFLFLLITSILLWNLALHWTPPYPYLSLYAHRVSGWISTQWHHDRQWISSEENHTLTLSCQSDVDQVSNSHRVIGYHPMDTWQVIFLDGGRNQGVKVGQIAIDKNGFLAGRISRVYAAYSELLLITNPQETVDVRIGAAGYRALVSGRFERLTAKRGIWLSQAEFIDHLSAVLPGDSVVTSGLDGTYPPHLPVGKIYKVWKDALNLFQDAIVIPGIDFSELETVYLLTPNSSGLSL